jgi:hypothetical protein
MTICPSDGLRLEHVLAFASGAQAGVDARQLAVDLFVTLGRQHRILRRHDAAGLAEEGRDLGLYFLDLLGDLVGLGLEEGSRACRGAGTQRAVLGHVQLGEFVGDLARLVGIEVTE